MASFSHYALQKALYQKLTGNTPLMAVVTGIFDRAAQGTAFPYITIGDAVIHDWSTKSATGTQQLVEIHIWSREGGRKQAAEIMDMVYGLLHNGSLTVEAQALVMIRFVSSNLQLESDGWTYHGAMRLRVLLEAA